MHRTVLIAYDIPCNRRRGRVLRLLQRWRADGQRSAHECRLAPAQAEALYRQLLALIQPAQDRLLFAFTDLGERRGLGSGAAPGGLRLFR